MNALHGLALFLGIIGLFTMAASAAALIAFGLYSLYFDPGSTLQTTMLLIGILLGSACTLVFYAVVSQI